MTYNPAIDAWQDTEGLVYNHELGAWQKVWSADVKVYMDATLGWPLTDGQTLGADGFTRQNADGSYTIRAQDDSHTVVGCKGITFEPPQGRSKIHMTLDSYSRNNVGGTNNYVAVYVVASNVLEQASIDVAQIVFNSVAKGTGRGDETEPVEIGQDTVIDISQYKSYRYFCIGTSTGSGGWSTGWTEITVSNIYFE